MISTGEAVFRVRQVAAVDRYLLLKRVLLYALVASLLIPTAFHIYATHDSRFIADDFCFANVAQQGNVGQSLNYWYNGWTGPYTEIVALTLLTSVSPQIAGVLLPVILLLWLIVTCWTLSLFFEWLRIPVPDTLAILFAGLLTYALFEGVPNIVQSVYWMTSAINYFVPLILLIAYGGLSLWVMKHKFRLSTYLLAFTGSLVVLFVAAGCSETSAALQLTVLTFVLLGFWRTKAFSLNSRLTLWLVFGILCTVVSLLIMASAPGNAVRAANFIRPDSLPAIAVNAFIATAGYLLLAISRFTLLPLLVVVLVSAAVAFATPVPASIARLIRMHLRQYLTVTAIITFVLAASTITPAIYALSTPPPARVYVLTQLVMIGGVTVWSVLLAWGFQLQDYRGTFRRSSRFAYGVSLLIVALIVLGPVGATIRVAHAARQYDSYAAQWDAQDQSIRAAQARERLISSSSH